MEGVRLVELLDVGRVARLAEQASFAAARAAGVCQYVTACAGALRRSDIAGDARALAFFVPGRIEILGKHTDYAGGRSLLAACERGFIVVATPRNDRRMNVLDVVSGESASFAFDADIEPDAGWTNYPMTVARRVARNFPEARVGADIAFLSDLPAAAGMSSSSALIVATFLALAGVNDLTRYDRYREVIRTSEDLAGYLATVENGEDFGVLRGDRGVGTQGGSEDHVAMLCGQAGHVVQYAFAPVRFERTIRLPSGHTFMIGVSGVHAEKTGAARNRYNKAAELMRVAAELWRAETGGSEATVGAVIERGEEATNRLLASLGAAPGGRVGPQALLRRVAHFLHESAGFVPAAGDALQRADLTAFGNQVYFSQRLAEDLLRNQVPETVHLAHSARSLGAVAASAFGAGFGGSVWALVREAEAQSFLMQWLQDYVSAFPPRRADSVFFQTGAGLPATRLA